MKLGMEIPTLRRAFSHGLDPADFYADLTDLIDSADPAIWISRVSREALAGYLARLDSMPFETSPLWGVPFAVKDNIDLAGLPTTAACPAFAYTPERSAFVVEKLMAAGAIPIGKTNLDQFATGLVGVRSPYGHPKNALDESLVPGGSSSGSAVAVARGLVSFALGTDTAGSGRVPAALNGIVGLKPSKGLLSCRGVVPACRSLDCVSIFAGGVDDARTVLTVAEGFDGADPFSRSAPKSAVRARSGFTFGIPCPEQLNFFGRDDFAALYRKAVEGFSGIGGRAVEIDFSPFAEAARLLYEGPWVAERYLVVKALLDKNPGALLEVTRGIIAKGSRYSAADVFAATYRLEELRKAAEAAFASMDFLLLPTAGFAPTLDEVAADPVGVNSRLGTYTNFVNLLDLCGAAVPVVAGGAGRPFGVTLLAPAFCDGALLDYAGAYARGSRVAEDGEPDSAETLVAVCGAHMRGLALNGQIASAGGRFVGEARTSPSYRLILLEQKEGLPTRPGLVRVSRGSASKGASVALEIWSVPTARFGGFVEKIPAPLAIGSVELADGTWLKGFVCEGYAAVGAEDITSYGGWRGWLAR